MKRGVKYSKAESVPSVLKESSVPVSPEGHSAMVRTQIYLSRSEYDFVQAESTRRGEPMAAVIRSFIDEKMQLPEDAWTNNPMLRAPLPDPDFNAPADAAINHDHYLYGTPKKWVRVRGNWVEAPPLPDDYYENDASYLAYNRRVSALEAAQ